MPLSNLALCAVKNRLRSLQLPSIELAAASFSLPSNPVLLDISAQGTEFVLAVAQTPAIFALPQLSTQQQTLQSFKIPPQLLAAFLELHLQPQLKVIAKELETTVLITGYGNKFNPDKFAYCLSFYLHQGALHLPLMLYCKNKFTLYNLLQKLDEIYIKQQRQLQQQQQLPPQQAALANSGNSEDSAITEVLRVIVGYSLITPKEFVSLEVGDALMIEQLCLNADHLVVSFANFLAHATIKSGKVILNSNFTARIPLYQYLPQNLEGAMSPNPSQNQGQGSNPALNPRPATPADGAMGAAGSARATTSGAMATGAAAAMSGATMLAGAANGAMAAGASGASGAATVGDAISLHSLDELPLEVNFVLERQLMTLAQLKQLQAGSEIVLTNNDLSNVTLEINGQAVATGRIIDLGERFALQILKKGQ